MTLSKDFIVHMVATPALSSEGGDVEPPCKLWLSINAIDEQYLTNHARQVYNPLNLAILSLVCTSLVCNSSGFTLCSFELLKTCFTK